MAPKSGSELLRGAELRRVLGVWPTVMHLATDDWARDFALSIWKQAGEPRWKPSLKQSRVMRKMACDLAAYSATEKRLGDQAQ